MTSGEIVELVLPSERIQMTVEEVIDVLGEPVSHEYDDAEQQYSARYETGDNILLFSYVEKGDSVYVELR